MLYNELQAGDLDYREYQERQSYEISPAAVREQCLRTEPAGKFRFNGNSWEPMPYEGYAVVAMLDENEGNEMLSAHLCDLQERLSKSFEKSHGIYLLPPSSFHQTIANTISADRYQQAIRNNGLEDEFPYIVDHAFRMIGMPVRSPALHMRMTGLSIFGTAIGILGVFDSAEDYQRILRFRSGFYGNELLRKLEIVMTRPFIGHITIAYIERELTREDREVLTETVISLNREAGHYLSFNISKCALRHYSHLASFTRKDYFPSISL